MSKKRIVGIRFIVTSACNYNCTYCHNEWEPKLIPLAKPESRLIDALILAAKELGAREVDLTGGEPLLEMDRVEMILDSAKKHGLWTNLTTNGFYLQENMENLRKRGLNEIHIHIPSLDPNKYRRIMGGNSDLGKVINAVHAGRNAFDKTMINIPIERVLNEEEIPGFIEYFGRLGITPRFIESMSTGKYLSLEKDTTEKIVAGKFQNVEKKGEYLWGISKYVTNGFDFETLRCICYDRKCDICSTTNFIHVDKDYNIRPCNLRGYRFPVDVSDAKQALIKASEFLREQKDIPPEYKKLWEDQPL